MWLFIDETWSERAGDLQIGVLLGVLVEEQTLPRLESLLYSVRKKYYGREHARDLHHELKGKALLSNWVLRRHEAGEPMNNVNVVREMLSYPVREGIFFKAFASTVYRLDGTKPTLLSPDPKRLAQPFRLIIANAAAAAAEHRRDRKVTLVFDQRLGAQRDMAVSIRNFIEGIGLSSIRACPYFAVSNVCPGIQYADVLATILRSRAEGRGRTIQRLYEAMKPLQWTSGDRHPRWGFNRLEESAADGELSYRRRAKW